MAGVQSIRALHRWRRRVTKPDDALTIERAGRHTRAHVATSVLIGSSTMRVLPLLFLSAAVLASQSLSSRGDDGLTWIVERAWEPPPASIDATMIVTRFLRPKSEDSIRERIRRQATIVGGKGIPIPDEVFEREVEKSVQRSLLRNNGPIQIMRRVRQLGPLQRIDQRVFWADEVLDVRQPYLETLVNGPEYGNGIVDNWSVNEIDKVVSRDLRKSKPLYKRDRVLDIGGIGEANRIVLQIATRNDAAAALWRLEPDPHKVAQLVEGAHPELTIDVSVVDAQGDARQQWELRTVQHGVHPFSRLVTTLDEPKVIQEVQLYGTTTGSLTQTIINSDFDDRGVPRRCRQEVYHEDGFIEVTEFEVLEFDPNAEISKEVFAYSVPQGYAEIVHDAHGTSMTAAEDVLHGLARPAPVPGTRQRWMRWILVGNIGFAGICILYTFWWSRRKRARGRKTQS